MGKEISLNHLKKQFDYMAFLIFVKTIGYIQLNKKINPYLFKEIIKEFNIFYNIEFDENNILQLGKKIIEEQFYSIIEKIKSGVFDCELEITNDILKKVKELKQDDPNYKNNGDMYTDYVDGKYYRLFLRLGTTLSCLDVDRTDVGLGETLYHSLARFGSEGVNEYFDYFKIMCEYNIVNYQNQSQQNGFCNCNPCIYWLLSSKKQLEYFNYLIKIKDIMLNHICGNEKGPSAFGIITDMIYKKEYWDRIENKFLVLDKQFMNMLCETLYNISKSNFSIGFDLENIIKLLKIDYYNYYIDNMFKYLVSDEAIEKQYNNNKYPIYLGGTIDNLNKTDVLNEKYSNIVNLVKQYYHVDKQKIKQIEY